MRLTEGCWDPATHAFWHGATPMSFTLSAFGAQEALVSGEGAWLIDAGGRRFLDARAGICNVLLGYSRTDIVAAMHRQAATLPFACTLRFERPAQVTVEYAQALAETAPRGLTRVRFTHTGSSAVEAALLMSRLYHRNLGSPQRQYIIGLEGSYHGSTLMCMAAGGYPQLRELFGPMPAGFAHVPVPELLTCPACVGTNPAKPACVEPLLAEIGTLGPENIAAVIVEPLIANCGLLLPAHYLHALRQACSEHDILLIFDEVLSGFGRTGPMFAAEHYGVSPDIMCLSKGITSAYAPLGAVLTTSRVYDAFNQPGKPYFAHGSSTDAHPVCCAAGLAVLEAYSREKITRHGMKMADDLRHALTDRLSGSALVSAVRGIGAFIVIDVQVPQGGPALADLMRYLEARCAQLGLFIDHTRDTIELTPPLTLTSEESRIIAEIIATVLSEIEQGQAKTISTQRPPSASGRR